MARGYWIDGIGFVKEDEWMAAQVEGLDWDLSKLGEWFKKHKGVKASAGAIVGTLFGKKKKQEEAAPIPPLAPSAPSATPAPSPSKPKINKTLIYAGIGALLALGLAFLFVKKK